MSRSEKPTRPAILRLMTAETTPWRLIVDGPIPGAANMARDVALLESVAAGDTPPTLFDPSCRKITQSGSVTETPVRGKTIGES